MEIAGKAISASCSDDTALVVDGQVHQVIGVLTSASVVCYSLYAVGIGEASSARGAMEWTIPLVIYGILRYLYVVRRLDVGGDPTALLWRDRPLQVAVVLWGGLSSGLIYLAT